MIGSARADIVTTLCGSLSNREIIAQADQVVACTMPVDWKLAKPQGEGVVFPEGPMVSVPRDVADRVRTLLLAPGSYRVGGEEKDCSPDYQIRIRFMKGTESIDVDFCFGCDVLIFRRDTEVFGEEDFDPASESLFAEFLGLFPDDTAMKMYDGARKARKKRQTEANQALQTTSVTRSGFGKVAVSDPQRRGV
jgi:hypothetical protein